MRENTDQNNSEYGHFSRSDHHQHLRWFEDNLITSHNVDYMSSALIPAEAAENDQVAKR